jgi:hypothetical protein
MVQFRLIESSPWPFEPVNIGPERKGRILGFVSPLLVCPGESHNFCSDWTPFETHGRRPED